MINPYQIESVPNPKTVYGAYKDEEESDEEAKEKEKQEKREEATPPETHHSGWSHPYHPSNHVPHGNLYHNHWGLPHPPSFEAWKSGAYLSNTRHLDVRARYNTAQKACKGKKSDAESYECFRIEWANYNPNPAPAAPREDDFNLEAIRSKLYLDCRSKFPKDPSRANRCIENGVKRYEVKLFAEVAADEFEKEMDFEATEKSLF